VLAHVMLTQMVKEVPTTLPPNLAATLEQYQSIFKKPNGLPPKRKVDHQIVLKPHTASVNQRPYRCNYYQKLELDKIIEELLKTEVIQPLTNPYSSHALLVKKKDENWRLCVDYKWLNKLTDKN
jgi:hypothetical protein